MSRISWVMTGLISTTALANVLSCGSSPTCVATNVLAVFGGTTERQRNYLAGCSTFSIAPRGWCWYWLAMVKAFKQKRFFLAVVRRLITPYESRLNSGWPLFLSSQQAI